MGTESVGLAQLHIARGATLPRAVDLIGVEPVSGAASAERVVVGSRLACDREDVRCHRVEQSALDAPGLRSGTQFADSSNQTVVDCSPRSMPQRRAIRSTSRRP